MGLFRSLWGSGKTKAGGTLSEEARRELRNNRLELILAVLLGIAALGTAVAAYQSGKEGGATILNYNLAIRTTNESSQLVTEGNQVFVQDQAIFLDWATAAAADEDFIAEYIQSSLMRPELQAAVAWWADQPGDKYDTPFHEDNPDYSIESYEEAAALDEKTNGYFRQAGEHDEKGGRFDLVTVLFAASLFILGIATVVRAWAVKLAVVGLGTIIFVGSLIQLGRIYWS